MLIRHWSLRGAFIAAMGAFLILFYQNCGGGFSTLSQPSSSLDSLGDSGTPPQNGDPNSPTPPPPTGQPSSPNSTLNLGILTLDGPATFEQISLLLPLTGSLDYSAKATVVFRKASEATWYQAHPLHRMRPEFSETNKFLSQGFAGVITGLQPNTQYEIQVSVESGASRDVRTLTAATRALPSSSGPATKKVPAGSTSAQIKTILSSAAAGDVIEFENGTYIVDGLQVSKGGNESSPLVIRGASRNGVILKDVTGAVLQIVEADHVIIERLTLEGSGVDSGVGANSIGISLWSGYSQKNITLRHLNIRNVDMGIVASHTVEQISIYDSTLTGNNKWDQDLYAYGGSGAPGSGDGTRDGEQNVFWNDDGIRIPGRGNVAFNNTLHGFGDALAVTSGVHNAGVHFYRNDITMTGDDAFEGDYGVRNISFYDNRIHNAMTFVSFDPLYGGPAFVFRNIAINIRRGPLKLNATNTGMIFANNTIVTTNGANDVPWAWVQYNNGALKAWSYRNNILIRRNVSSLMAMEASGQDPIDFTHNAWFPNGSVWWSNSGPSGNSMANVFAKMSNTTPLFGTSTKRHDFDLIIEADPFESEIALGGNYRTLVTTRYIPKLKQTSTARGQGIAIPGITDGHSGSAPDIGAVISGRPSPFYGDRSGN